MTKQLQINKYKADFAEFTVAWVISLKHESCKICKKFQNYVDGMNFYNFTSGYREPQEISTDCTNSHSSGQKSVNWVDFAQFTVNFESSIYHGANRKMVCEFRIICMNSGLFGYLGGVRGFLTVHMCANGVDFVSFII